MIKSKSSLYNLTGFFYIKDPDLNIIKKPGLQRAIQV